MVPTRRDAAAHALLEALRHALPLPRKLANSTLVKAPLLASFAIFQLIMIRS